MITQAIVTKELTYDNDNKRQYIGVYTLPEGQNIPFVDFPQTPDIYPPVANSIVLIDVHDSYNAGFICTLSIPSNNLSRPNLPLTPEGQPHIQPGERQLANAAGASVFLDNSGGISLHASSVIDNITIDGTGVGVDGTIVELTAIPELLGLQPHLKLDKLCNISLAIQDPLLKINLWGVRVDILGNVSIYNKLSSVTLDALGGVAVLAARNVSISSALAVSVTAGGTVSVTAGGAASVNAGGAVSVKAGGKVSVSAVAEVNVTAAKEITVYAPSVSLGGPDSQALATEDFVLEVFDTHTHGGVAPGTSTTSPPLIPSIAVPTSLTLITEAQ